MREIRIPLYGMVQLSELEWEIVNSAPFQRLRRIKQLAFSDLVYPGAVHTRFEHSLGVMHLASRAFGRITAKPEVRTLLATNHEYNQTAFDRARRMVRFAALMHDFGHLPFSHAAEDVLPEKAGGGRYDHEDYSRALIRTYAAEILENSNECQNLIITATAVADFLEGRQSRGLAQIMLWRGLIKGELDCDRMDYLARDSHHMGVLYGVFDVERVISTLTIVEEAETGAAILGIEEGGLLAAESLILARYYMFQQVYFHKVRRFLDLQYSIAMKEILANSPLPVPDEGADLRPYLNLDDWWMQSEMVARAADGSDAARRVVSRDCWKVVFEVDRVMEQASLQEAQRRLEVEGISVLADTGAATAAQKFETTNIRVRGETGFQGVLPITSRSRVATAIPDRVYLGRLYVAPGDRNKAKAVLEDLQSHPYEGGEPS